MRLTRYLSPFFALALILVFGAVLSAGSTRANIPFDFEVSGKVLPAGLYRFDSPAANGVMRITSSDGTATLVLTRSITDKQAAPEIRFDKRDGVHKLTEVIVRSAHGTRAVRFE